MGFCFPGYDKHGGDSPPRPECAPLYQARLTEQMPQVQLTLLIGQYAQKAYLGKTRYKTLTETVRHGDDYGPNIWPLPHPSWRNNGWLKRHDWFEDIIAELRIKVAALITDSAQ